MSARIQVVCGHCQQAGHPRRLCPYHASRTNPSVRCPTCLGDPRVTSRAPAPPQAPARSLPPPPPYSPNSNGSARRPPPDVLRLVIPAPANQNDPIFVPIDHTHARVAEALRSHLSITMHNAEATLLVPLANAAQGYVMYEFGHSGQRNRSVDAMGEGNVATAIPGQTPPVIKEEFDQLTDRPGRTLNRAGAPLTSAPTLGLWLVNTNATAQSVRVTLRVVRRLPVTAALQAFTAPAPPAITSVTDLTLTLIPGTSNGYFLVGPATCQLRRSNATPPVMERSRHGQQWTNLTLPDGSPVTQANFPSLFSVVPGPANTAITYSQGLRLALFSV